MTDLKDDIQMQLTELDSGLDLLALERPGSESLRIFIDHPDGVDLALCERVTRHLNHLLADYTLEVSSPGPKHRRRNLGPENGDAADEQAPMSDPSRAGGGETKELP